MTVDEWMDALSAPAPDRTIEQAAAQCILNEMGLRLGSGSGVDWDRDNLARALIAYARLLHKYGLRP